MNDDWRTGWDPYEELLLARNNIQQCVLAINSGSEIMKSLAQRLNHNEQIISELSQQNHRLIIDNKAQRQRLDHLQQELLVLKQQNSSV